MRPAIAHGVWVASLVSGAIVAGSMAAIYVARRRDRAVSREERS
jgi:acyl dehydratase